MRWNTNKFEDVRIVNRFLLIPLSDGKQTRWLEWAKLKKSYHGSWGGSFWQFDGFVD